MRDNIFKSTMTSGLFLGVLFFVNFVLNSSSNVFIKLLSFLLIAFIIIVSIKNTKNYRDKECNGTITYGRVFQYVTFMFLFAGIISSLFKIIYLQHINPDMLTNMFEESVRQIEQNRALFDRFNLPLDDKYFEELENQMKPVSYSLQSIWVNLIFGLVLGFILGFFIKKEKSIFESDDNQTISNV